MASDVIIHKFNESYITIECSDALAHEISEVFTFLTPGHRFSPAFKARKWDGKKRLFNMRHRTLLQGLATKVEEFCVERDYTFEYSYNNSDEEFSLIEAAKFVESLNLPKDLELRKYQIISFCKAIRKRGGLLISPTGSGKTLILYFIIRYLEQFKKRGLFVVPRIQLTRQLLSDFRYYSENNGWDVDNNVQLIYEGQSKKIESYLTCSTWQSINKDDPEWFEQFDFVLTDESHEADSKSLDYIVTRCKDADFRYGQTGSLKDTKVHELILIGLFGEVIKETTTKQLINDKHLSELEIKCLVLKHGPLACAAAQGKKYPEELELLFASAPRNNFIANLAISLEGDTLVLFQYIEKHGKILKELIQEKLDKAGSQRKVYYIHGGTDVEIREEIRSILNDEVSKEGRILIASTGTTATGVDIPSLKYLINTSPSKARVKLLQSIGRILRLDEGKDGSVMFDIADDLRVKVNKENYTLKHFAERVRIYSEEKHKIKIYKIQLKD